MGLRRLDDSVYEPLHCLAGREVIKPDTRSLREVDRWRRSQARAASSGGAGRGQKKRGHDGP